jgi:hypothetical protein
MQRQVTGKNTLYKLNGSNLMRLTCRKYKNKQYLNGTYDNNNGKYPWLELRDQNGVAFLTYSQEKKPLQFPIQSVFFLSISRSAHADEESHKQCADIYIVHRLLVLTSP